MLDDLVPVVYAELRRLAHRQLQAEAPGHTLCTTALVHETYLKLAAQARLPGANREQFFALAALAMRRILVDYARRHRAIRRGGAARRAVTLGALDAAGANAGALGLAADQRADALLALDAALVRLGALDARLARVVECRFFIGLSEKETAQVLGISQRTAARAWVIAKGWLYQELSVDGA